jgi:hypothetical protein
MTVTNVRWAVICIVALAGCAQPPPRQVVDAGQARVNEFLARATTEGQLAAFAGMPPERCIASVEGARLCQWRLGNRQEGWEPLARAAGTRDQVNLLCELPAEGPRTADSCLVFPRRSDRDLYAIPKPSGKQNRRASNEAKAAAQDRHRRSAQQQLEGAQTLVALSHLVGAAPDGCSALDAETRLCFWRANNQTYGHGTLVMTIGASKGDRVVMRCSLPRDGAPRASESCRVEVGS